MLVVGGVFLVAGILPDVRSAERRGSCGFGAVLGWMGDGEVFIFVRTIPLMG